MQLTATACRDDDQDHYGVGALSVRELKHRRRELGVSLGLTPPGTPGRRSVDLALAAVDSELARRYLFERAYPAREDQVRKARHAVADFLTDCPCAGEATLIASELAANAVLHTKKNVSFCRFG